MAVKARARIAGIRTGKDGAGEETGYGYRKSKMVQRNQGFGFIMPDDGGKDVFVHITAVQAAGLRGLNEDQAVSYDIAMERGKAAATNLKAL